MSRTAVPRISIRALLITGCAALPLLASVAHAAPLRTPLKPLKTHSASLQDAVGGRAVRTLDWRTPAVDLRFDLSETEAVRSLELTLSADPLPGVDPSLPLVVQFNGGPPTTLDTRGRGFDATIELDASRVRARNNVLRVSHAVPCASKAGGFTLNLDESALRVTSRARNRSLQLREVESRLGASAFAPSTVGLIASGDGAARLQALGAQAIGLRMASIPEFQTTTRGTDFNVIMLPRHELHAYTSEPAILARSGPRIELSREHGDRLFLTGDTDAEVLQSASAFATFFLPRSRRSATSPGELVVQSPLDYARISVDGTARLDALSVSTGALREFTFDVADPAASGGDLVLRLTRDSNTAPGARLKAVLNGESLGEATLDGRRKTVSYPIRSSQLRGSGNRLELTTKAARGTDSCGANEPFIAIGAGSKLRLSAERPSALTDLSRFAADGSVFGENAGINTDIVLPTDDAAFVEALRIVAKLGVATGRGWTGATVVRGDVERDSDADTPRHRLVIEPFDAIETDVVDAAPRGLRSAWRGAPLQGENRLASVERFASLDAEDAVRMAARRLRASGDVGSGGVASIYPGERGQMIGVISNTPGRSFANAVRPLVEDAHWNGMSGSVSRWNDNAIVLAQTAVPVPGTVSPQGPEHPSWTERLASLEAWDRLDLPEVELPRLAWPDSALRSVDQVKTRIARWRTGDRSQPKADGAVFRPSPNTAPTRALDTVMPAGAQQPSTERLQEPEARFADAAPAPVAKRREAATERPAPSGLAAKLRGRIDLSAQSQGQTASATRFNLTRSAKRWTRSVRNGLRNLELKASRKRAEWRRRSGLRKPSLNGYRLGGYEIHPAMLLVVLAALLTVIGLAFVTATNRGSRHP